ncbi:MAG: MoaD/ThiS family protein [Actinomyces sp.]|uniref:MoaD/ThiS family protein n=1 Tax=Actinomyces sp. TaxID=29317 RepID=UPI0026DC55B8|nr:MoaD/ThiS family protein [Actinomyces sp.]MDO4242304.1 MoaD/ThiS family protein [Actinomyces sp.]
MREPVTTSIAVDLRYFAAAADAAGQSSESLELPVGTTLADLRTRLHSRGAEMERVVRVSSFLVNAVVASDDSVVLGEGDRVDVLPPFAGG